MKKIIAIAMVMCGFSTYLMAQTINSVTITNGTTFCTGDTLDITTSTSGSFGVGNLFSAVLSNPSGGFATGSTTLQIISGNAGGSFQAIVPNVISQSSSFLVKVTATNPVTEQIALGAITINQTASLSISATSICNTDAPYSLTLYPNGGSFTSSSSTGAIGNTFYPSFATIGANNVTYTLAANGCSNSASVVIQVNQTPQTPILTGETVLCPNDTVIVSIQNYNAAFNYLWSNGFTASSDTILVAGNYTVTASNNGCNASSANFTINSSSQPQNFSIVAPDSSCQGNNPILLSGVPSGGNFSSSNVVGGYFTPNLVGQNTVTYSYQNQYGCVFTTTKNITVTPIAVVSFSPIASLCLNSTPVNLSTAFLVSGGTGTGNSTFTGGGVVGGVFNPAIAGVGSQTIICNYSDSLGCSASQIGNVVVLGNSNINFVSPSNICFGNDSIVLSATPLLGTFSGLGVVNGVFKPSLAGVGSHSINYTTASTGSTCSSTATNIINVYTLSANAGIDLTTNCGSPVNILATTNYLGTNNVGYTWTPTSGLSNSTTQNPAAAPIQTTQYLVTTAVDGCSDVDTINIIVNQALFSVSFSNQAVFTSPPFNVAFSNLTPNSFLYNFVWDFGDGSTLSTNSNTVVHQYLANGVFNVNLTATNLVTGCIDSHSVQSAVTTSNACAHQAIINQTSPIVGCNGDSITLTCNTIPNAQYQWNLNGFPISGAPNANYIATQSGSYTVTIYVNNCPQSSAQVIITLNPSPVSPTITTVGTIAQCGSSSTTLQANGGFQNYNWKKNGVPLNMTTQSITVSSMGYYSVTAYDANGCSSSSTQQAVNLSYLSPPNLCVVSIDTTGSDKPIIEWEKPVSVSAISQYLILRESNAAGVFDTIYHVSPDELSSKIDNSPVVNTKIRSYKYMLAIVDTCGTTTLPSSYHKTILLQASVGVGGVVNLLWNNYEGLPVLTYEILRRKQGDPFSHLVDVPASNGQTNQFTDITVPNTVDTFDYRVDLILDSNYFCDPSQKSIDGRAQRRHSNSNVGTNKVVIPNAIKETLETNIFKAAPNPSNGHFMISFQSFSSESVLVEVLNVVGSVVHTETWNLNSVDGIRVLHVPQLEDGVYFVNFKQANKMNMLKVVITK